MVAARRYLLLVAVLLGLVAIATAASSSLTVADREGVKATIQQAPGAGTGEGEGEGEGENESSDVAGEGEGEGEGESTEESSAEGEGEGEPTEMTSAPAKEDKEDEDFLTSNPTADAVNKIIEKVAGGKSLNMPSSKGDSVTMGNKNAIKNMGVAGSEKNGEEKVKKLDESGVKAAEEQRSKLYDEERSKRVSTQLDKVRIEEKSKQFDDKIRVQAEETNKNVSVVGSMCIYLYCSELGCMYLLALCVFGGFRGL